MKKITAYIFILLANTVLLVHAVTFHHHHHTRICKESTHCQSNAVACNHSSPAESHQHDGSGAENCALEQAVVLPSNQGRHESDRIAGPDNLSYDSLFTLIHTGTNNLIPALSIDLPIPVIHDSYASFIVASLGLRAPPTV